MHTGAIVSKIEPSMDYVLGKAGQPFDWDKGFHISYNLKAKNQEVSSACGGFACSYYKESKNSLDGLFQNKSPKFIYANTHASGGGTSIYSLGNFLKKSGSASEAICSSFPATEDNLTSKVGITQEAINDGLKDLISSYAQITTLHDIESIAQAIRDNNGCIIGIYGKNNGSWRTEDIKPPLATDTDKFAHWMFATGAGMRNGEKAIRLINSWGDTCGDKGYQWITEKYFTSGNIWCAWVITEKENIIVPEFKYQFKKNMKFGDSNTDVKALQKALKLEGYTQDVTGYFGPMTLANVKKFQSSHGLVPDGIVGIKSIAVLNKLYA